MSRVQLVAGAAVVAVAGVRRGREPGRLPGTPGVGAPAHHHTSCRNCPTSCRRGPATGDDAEHVMVLREALRLRVRWLQELRLGERLPLAGVCPRRSG